MFTLVIWIRLLFVVLAAAFTTLFRQNTIWQSITDEFSLNLALPFNKQVRNYISNYRCGVAGAYGRPL